MNTSSNKRCARICNVIYSEKFIRRMKENNPMGAFMVSTADGLEQMRQEAINRLIYKPSWMPLGQRIEQLKNWNDVWFCNEGAIKILDFLEETLSIETEVKELENKLSKRGIKIDEPKFRELCSGGPKCPELDVTPSTSTPTNKEKTALKSDNKTPKTSAKKAKKASPIPLYVKNLLKDNTSNKIQIGPNGTLVSRSCLEKEIDWSKSSSIATRKILVDVFGRDTLASHSLTGKGSPAFLDCDKPVKPSLDKEKVEDITYFIRNIFEVTTTEVHAAITTKCADANKAVRLAQGK